MKEAEIKKLNNELTALNNNVEVSLKTFVSKAVTLGLPMDQVVKDSLAVLANVSCELLARVATNGEGKIEGQLVNRPEMTFKLEVFNKNRGK